MPQALLWLGYKSQHDGITEWFLWQQLNLHQITQHCDSSWAFLHVWSDASAQRANSRCTFVESRSDFMCTEVYICARMCAGVCSSALPGKGKKEKIRNGTTQSSAKAWSTPMMSTRIRSEMCGVQKTTKQSCANTDAPQKAMKLFSIDFDIVSLEIKKSESLIWDKSQLAGHKSWSQFYVAFITQLLWLSAARLFPPPYIHHQKNSIIVRVVVGPETLSCGMAGRDFRF